MTKCSKMKKSDEYIWLGSEDEMVSILFHIWKAINFKGQSELFAVLLEA